MKFSAAIAALTLALSQTANAATAEEWRSRAIYQVLTDRFARTDGSTTSECITGDRKYCGGTYQGIITHLDYIQNMGFDAVWISPVTKQIEGKTAYGEAFHGYWQQDLYSLNEHFGTADDLKQLSSELHKRGMYLMVDVVVNHFGWNGSPSNITYSMLHPFNKQSQYHPYCSIDYNDYENATQLEDCWSGDTKVPLPDLRTEDSDVQEGYNTWIKQLVGNYSIDGIRMDTAMQVNVGFWEGFVEAAGVYIVGEIYEPDVAFVCGFQDYLPGVLNYGYKFPLVDAFSSTSGDMSALADMIDSVNSDCKDPSVLGTFSENHDIPRFASITGDMSLARNVVAGTMLADGIPIIYEGQEQHYNGLGGGSDPYNREAVWYSKYAQNATLYSDIGRYNQLRKHAQSDDNSFLTSKNHAIYTDTTTIAMKKGQVVSVLSNKGENGASYTQSIGTGYPSGTKVTEILSCTTLTADGSGNIKVPMTKGVPRVYYPTSRLSGSGICNGNTKRVSRIMPRPRKVEVL